jgi:hypothetical protein
VGIRKNFTIPGGITVDLTGTTFFVDDPNNRVGINRDNPEHELDVSGVIRGSSGVITLTSNGAPTVTIGDGALAVDSTNHLLYFRSGSVWRNLLGPTGPTGPQGIQGPTGPTGPTESASVANVLYVSKSGSDTNDGSSLANSKLTIKSALAIASSDTTVFVKSGNYVEDNPITIPTKVSLVGDSARSVTVRPLNTSSDIFYVNNGSYVTGITFRDHVSPAAAIAFNPNGSAGSITQSPYVFDCSSITTTGTGMRVDGSVVTGGKSMLAGQFTQINLGGKGIHLLNQGYAQLIAIYTICCDISVVCESGGFCSLIGSDTSFGNYGLKASGVSSLLYSGTTEGALATQAEVVINGLSQTPYVNNVVTFDDGDTYYAISEVTPVEDGSSTITLDQTLATPIESGTTAKFYQPSKIMAANHTFEYCGSGIDLVASRPQFGGIPIQENEIVEEFGGQVFYTSTDHKGDFRIGSDLKIDRGSGAIQGIAFDRSIFATITPYILALEG